MIKKINGILLNYKVAGNGALLVFIHGHPFDYTIWDPQVAALSGKYQVITPDLRGYGRSTFPTETPTRFEDYATDILCLLDELKITNFHLAGLSMGGQIIMEMYRQAPERIKSLIFVDTFAGLDTPGIKQGRYDTALRLENEGMDTYSEEVINQMIRPEHVTSMPRVADFVLRMMKATSPFGAAIALRARAERIDYLTEVLPKITIPCLVIVGRQDEFTPVAKAVELRTNLKHCKLVVIEDAGHLPNLEQPDEFNHVLLDFLQSVNGL